MRATAPVLTYPEGIAADGSGDIFVVNSNNTVTVYAAGADGNVAPERTIGGAHTRLNASDALAIDASGAVYVANLGAGGRPAITVYAPGANGDVAPTATIEGDHTGLHIPTGITVDPSGNIYVSNYDESVTAYAPDSDGDAQPTLTIRGRRTQLDANYGIALDPRGTIFVSNQGLTSGPYSVTAYANRADGDTAPLRTLSGSMTGLIVPNGLAVH